MTDASLPVPLVCAMMVYIVCGSLFFILLPVLLFIDATFGKTPRRK